MGVLIIDDSTSNDVLFPKEFGRGAEPRDLKTSPLEMFSTPPSSLKVIPRNEWSARIREKKELGTNISDVRRRGNRGGIIPTLNQTSWGYCWAHSTTFATIMARALAGMPYVPLSAFSVAVPIKNGKNEGGWCGLSMEFARDKGIASQALWPQGNGSTSLYTADVKANMLLHRVTDDVFDLSKAVYDQSISFDLVATCLLSNIPLAIDLMWWSHSVTALDLVEVEAGSYGVRIANSWSDTWEDQGEAVLRDSKAKPDAAVGVIAPRAAA